MPEMAAYPYAKSEMRYEFDGVAGKMKTPLTTIRLDKRRSL
jgi:hypothetical protein